MHSLTAVGEYPSGIYPFKSLQNIGKLVCYHPQHDAEHPSLSLASRFIGRISSPTNDASITTSRLRMAHDDSKPVGYLSQQANVPITLYSKSNSTQVART